MKRDYSLRYNIFTSYRHVEKTETNCNNSELCINSRKESCSLRHVNESQTSWPHNRTDNELSYYQNTEKIYVIRASKCGYLKNQACFLFSLCSKLHLLFRQLFRIF